VGAQRCRREDARRLPGCFPRRFRIIRAERGGVRAEGVDVGSVTVKSTDGFTSTYTLDPTTKVHNGKTTATVAQIATNDRVRLQATKTGSTVTAHHIGDAGPTPAK